jgi:hypothetical protein
MVEVDQAIRLWCQHWSAHFRMTFGGAIAGIRYFGDFERFSSISDVTSKKLSAIHTRMAQLMDIPESAIDYGPVAELAREVDDVVVDKIESWQAVFAGKHVAVPV